MGVPTLGCDCAVCTSADPHDKRLRPSVLLRWPEGGRERVVVIDTGPDFREQALRNGLTRVDAVFYTHSHADHIMGLDDLRPLSFTVFREGGQSLYLWRSRPHQHHARLCRRCNRSRGDLLSPHQHQEPGHDHH